MQSTNLFYIFLTGLTTGGLTCLALQGGLLTSVIAQESVSPLSKGEAAQPRGIKKHYLPILSFLSAKLIIHTLFGFLLGVLGASISLSSITRGWLQVAIGIYLFGVAGNLLNLHPLFRYFIITPPKFLAKLVKKTTKDSPALSKEGVRGRIKNIFAPALLGLMTIFIPCAVTQAMEVVAIGTGNPFYAATIMFAFILGTSPTFLIFGFLLNQGSTMFRKYFPTVAAVAMFGMSAYSINAGIGLMGSVYTIQNFIEAASTSSRHSGPDPESIQETSVLGDKTQTATITVGNSGYTPSSINLKKGIPAKIKLITNNIQSCSRSFTIPGLNIQKLLPETGETVIEFTPTESGPLPFSCSMGMYTGRFNIIN
jgi:sulfite exporter TauE/SafE